jgi:hypothetical protein
VKIRLEGKPDEISAVAERIAHVLDVQETSRFYANRGESALGRVYLNVGFPPSRTVHADAAWLDQGKFIANPDGGE